MNLVSADLKSSLPTNSESSPESDEAATTAEPALSRSLSSLADGGGGNSPDLQRALDLVDLHFGLKVKYIEENGNKVLDNARQEVTRALKDRT